MNQDEKDLVDTFKGLSPENRANLLAVAHATKAAQENTRMAMEEKSSLLKNPRQNWRN